MSAPRFPPPGNETGYRDVAIPTSPSRDAPMEKPRVIVTRPGDHPADEPRPRLSEAALRKQNARLRFQEWERRRMTRALLAFFVLAIVVSLAFQMVRVRERHKRQLTQSPIGSGSSTVLSQ